MLLKVSFQPHIGKSVAAQSREKFRHLPEAGGFLSVRLILNTFLPSDCSRASPPLFSASATTSVLLFSSSSQRTDTSFRAPLLFKPLILHAWLQRGYQHGEGGKVPNFLLFMSEEEWKKLMIPIKAYYRWKKNYFHTVLSTLP